MKDYQFFAFSIMQGWVEFHVVSRNNNAAWNKALLKALTIIGSSGLLTIELGEIKEI